MPRRQCPQRGPAGEGGYGWKDGLAAGLQSWIVMPCETANRAEAMHIWKDPWEKFKMVRFRPVSDSELNYDYNITSLNTLNTYENIDRPGGGQGSTFVLTAKILSLHCTVYSLPSWDYNKTLIQDTHQYMGVCKYGHSEHPCRVTATSLNLQQHHID